MGRVDVMLACENLTTTLIGCQQQIRKFSHVLTNKCKCYSHRSMVVVLDEIVIEIEKISPCFVFLLPPEGALFREGV